jgi:iron complex outermembrane receptor protein
VPFDPEYIWTYEMGLRSDFLDHRLRFNSTLFYSDYTDLQFAITVADPVTNSPISIVGNAAKAEIKGFEIEVVTLPTSALTLSGAIGYTDAEYTEVDPTAPISEDDKLPVTPKWTVTVSGEYAKPLGELGELIGRLDYAYKTEMYLQPINDPINFQDSYGFLNAKLTFEHASGNWAFSMFGTNLTDTRYLVAAHDTGPLNGLGFAMAQYGRPREWGASLIYRF